MADIKNTSQTHLKTIEDVMSEGFGRYAKYIIQDRALPNVKDGLKPVQRRIIYGMFNLGILHNTPHKKSARSVGDIMGKYHPHGDSSIYEAMVRMSQDWKNNLTIVDMQGCNGSLDGDGAAAMRYTESRLTQYAEMMVEGIKKNTVPLIPNYDGGEVEPAVLPSLLPNLLINGASGIAAGYATNIPPFNPNEVFDAVIARIDSPNCHLETIKNLMPGPDFPTGGFIHNLQGIDDAYATGKGKIVIRAKIDLVGKKQAFITQIPFEVNKAHLIDEIQDLAEQHESLNIIDCHDESDENGVSICINLKSTDNFDFVKNFLFKNTQAQVSYAINLTAIKDHKPYTMSILFILDAFIEHITEVTINAAKFDLAKAKLRKEVIEGLIKAISIIDEVVALIRRSTDKVSAKQALITKLLFTEVQAEAIVTLRLYRLTNSDVTELQEELKQIIEAIREFELIANDKTYRNNYIKNKLRSSKKLFNTPRKSVFSNEDATTVIDQNDIIEDRDNYLIITKDGYLKNVPTKSVVLSSPEELKIKEGDIPVAQFKSNQRHKLILITSKGNYVSIPVYKIETTRWKDNGVHINSIININSDEKIINAFNYDNNVGDSRMLIIASKKCMVKRTTIEDLGISKLTKSSMVMKLEENDAVVSAQIINQNDEDKNVCVITTTGRGIKYPLSQISVVGKNAAGVKNTGADEDIAALFVDHQNKEFACIAANQGFKRLKINDISLGARTNSPKFILSQIKSNPIVVINAFAVSQSDLISYVDATNQLATFKASEVPIGSTDTRVSSVTDHVIFEANSLVPIITKTKTLFES